MDKRKKAIELRKLSQQHAYTSIQLHESIGKRIGLPGTDHKYLGFFLQRGTMTAGELARVSGLTAGAVTGLIDRFEKKKLVKRTPDATDRRKILIVPNTEKIRTLVTPLYQDYQDRTDELFLSYSLQELAVLADYFQRSLEIMNRKMAALASK